MAKFKVYYTIELNEVATHIFESNDFEVKLCSHNDEETYVKELAEFQPDAIMCRTEPITAKMMDTCKNLKVIGKQGAGLDNIDMDHAHAKDITVVYAPAGNANAVAEHAVMLMLMCAKRFTYVDRQFRGGNFLVRMGMEHTYELGGKTLGMIGCGRISQLAMQKCKYGFSMNVIGYDPYLTQDKIGDLCELKATAKEVWEQADFVSVHLPVVPSTEHSIGREQFSWMKPTASFINCARGALIKENELVECLKDGTLTDFTPTAFIFGAKAAAGYRNAKLTIKLINNVADVINNDKSIGGKLKVVFIEDYRVSNAELIFSAADVSEQISTASKEASGTGNMKFMLNGALTLGTMDGANVEIVEEVGKENAFIFGLSAEQVIQYENYGGYNPMDIFNNDQDIRRVLMQLINGYYSPQDPELFRDIYNSLLNTQSSDRADTYFILKDFRSYAEAHKKIDQAYRDEKWWARTAMLNTASAGKFSSDRTIEEYVRDIWHLKKIKVELK